MDESLDIYAHSRPIEEMSKVEVRAVSARMACSDAIMRLMCMRGFGSPRIWLTHPKTLADLDNPKRGFGSPADLDPSITLYAIASRMMTSNVGSQIR